jgi:hypothetical protein
MARKKKEEPTTPQTNLELTEVSNENQITEENSSTTTTDENEWSSDVEAILRNVQQNCSLMSKHHKKRYLMLKGKLIYFRIPLIVLGSANSVFAVGLTAYLPQQDVSVINCMLSLVCTIITSIELFLGIQSGMEKEYVAQREFYLMAVDLYSALNLERHHRTMNGKRYLEKILSQYNKLIESSEVVRTKMEDKLLPVLSLAEDPESTMIEKNKNLASNV